MHKLLVLYPAPHDHTGFVDHYTSTHLTLVQELPEVLSDAHVDRVEAGIQWPTSTDVQRRK